MAEQLIFPGKVDWSGDGVATVNGRSLPGHAVPREMAGRQITTAFLTFAESWIR